MEHILLLLYLWVPMGLNEDTLVSRLMERILIKLLPQLVSSGLTGAEEAWGGLGNLSIDFSSLFCLGTLLATWGRNISHVTTPCTVLKCLLQIEFLFVTLVDDGMDGEDSSVTMSGSFSISLLPILSTTKRHSVSRSPYDWFMCIFTSYLFHWFADVGVIDPGQSHVD